MRQKVTDPAPAALLEVQRNFESWRSTHPRRTPFPEPLWAAAAAVAKAHGVYRTAKLLRLDSSTLKRKMPGAAPAPKLAPPAFVELLASGGYAPAECVIEMDRPRHGRLRLELKAWRTTDVADLVRQLWGQSE
jgi:hypothetical protein